MQTFEAWLIEKHPEILDEGWKDWAGKMALGGALTAGAMGLLGKGNMPHAPTPSGRLTVTQSYAPTVTQSMDHQTVNFGGVRKVSVDIKVGDDKGTGTVTFLGSKSFDPVTNTEVNDGIANLYAHKAIVKLAGDPRGTVRGFRITSTHQQEGWVVASFEWRSIE